MLCEESVAEISVPQKSLIVHTSRVLFTAISINMQGGDQSYTNNYNGNSLL